MNFCLNTDGVIEVECDEAENGKENEISMTGFAIKSSILEMVSLGLGEGGEKTVGVKVF